MPFPDAFDATIVFSLLFFPLCFPLLPFPLLQASQKPFHYPHLPKSVLFRIGDEELKEGDIITFISADPALEGAYNTHRIYDIVKDYTTGKTIYFTKGEAAVMIK